MSRQRPPRFTHYRDRDQPGAAYKPAICGVRGGRMGYFDDDDIDCIECLAALKLQRITLPKYKGGR